MTRFLFVLAFVLGAAVVLWVGLGFLAGQPVAEDAWVLHASPAECADKVAGAASALQANGHAAAMIAMYRGAAHPRSPDSLAALPDPPPISV